MSQIRGSTCLCSVLIISLSGCSGPVDVDIGKQAGGEIVGKVLGQVPTAQGLSFEPVAGARVAFSGNVILGCDQVSGPCVTSKAGGVFSIHNASEGSYTLYVYWRNQTCSTGVTVTRQSVVDVGELRVTLSSRPSSPSPCN